MPFTQAFTQADRKIVSFKQTTECQKAFNTLKEPLSYAPILGYPAATDQWYLDCNANSIGTAAVLSKSQNGQKRVIAYCSKSLNKNSANIA